MNDEIIFLLTIVSDESLVRVAIKLKRDQISDGLIKYPMEDSSRQELLAYLPSYLHGDVIVEVSEIHDIFDAMPLPKEVSDSTPRDEPTLSIIQREQKQWALDNFGEQLPHRALLGVVEELGELIEADPSSTDHILELIKALGRISHSQLKGEQGIRTTKDHIALAKDAVADMLIFLISYCNDKGYDLEDIVKETWSEVKKRDWKANPEDAHEVEDESPMSYKAYCDARKEVAGPLEMRFQYLTNYLPGFISSETAVLPARIEEKEEVAGFMGNVFEEEEASAPKKKPLLCNYHERCCMLAEQGGGPEDRSTFFCKKMRQELKTNLYQTAIYALAGCGETFAQEQERKKEAIREA